MNNELNFPASGKSLHAALRGARFKAAACSSAMYDITTFDFSDRVTFSISSGFAFFGLLAFEHRLFLHVFSVSHPAS